MLQTYIKRNASYATANMTKEKGNGVDRAGAIAECLESRCKAFLMRFCSYIYRTRGQSRVAASNPTANVRVYRGRGAPDGEEARRGTDKPYMHRRRVHRIIMPLQTWH